MPIHRMKRPAPLVLESMTRQPRAEVSADGVYREGGFEISRSGIVSEPAAPADTEDAEAAAAAAATTAPEGIDTAAAAATAHAEEDEETGAAAGGALPEPGMAVPAAAGAAALDARKGLRFEDFRILRVLGKGSGGIVHLAEHVPTGRLVAMKTVSFMSSEGGDDDRGVGADGAEKPSRMVSELLALDATGHCENVVAFYGAFFVDGATRILLEYMDAGSLKDLLVHGPIPMNVLGAIAEQVLHGLVYLHSRHLIHRDIKPGNLLVNTQGQVKIADFGVSDRKEHTLSTCHSIIGTVTYMSPERIDAQPYKIDSDVWSFGLVILECATGEYPYKTALLRGGRNRTLSTLEIMEQIVRGPAPQAPESMPASFRAFIAACLQREPAKRAPARALLEHPWILECQRHGASVEAWVSSTLGQEFDF